MRGQERRAGRLPVLREAMHRPRRRRHRRILLSRLPALHTYRRTFLRVGQRAGRLPGGTPGFWEHGLQPLDRHKHRRTFPYRSVGCRTRNKRIRRGVQQGEPVPELEPVPGAGQPAHHRHHRILCRDQPAHHRQDKPLPGAGIPQSPGGLRRFSRRSSRRTFHPVQGGCRRTGRVPFRKVEPWELKEHRHLPPAMLRNYGRISLLLQHFSRIQGSRA